MHKIISSVNIMSLDITTVSRQVYWLSHCTLSQRSVYKYIGCVVLLDITTVSAHVYRLCCITGHNKCICYWTSQVYWLCTAMVWLVVPWYLWPSLNEGSGLSGFDSLISTSPTKHPEDLPPHGILSMKLMNTKVCNWSFFFLFFFYSLTCIHPLQFLSLSPPPPPPPLSHSYI